MNVNPNELHLHRERLQTIFVVLRLHTDPQNVSRFCHMGKILTVDTNISIWQWEQWGMQRVLGVSQDWVPPICLFHNFKVCAVFLWRKKKEIKIKEDYNDP